MSHLADLVVTILHPAVCVAVLCYWIPRRVDFRGLNDIPHTERSAA